MLDTRLPPTHSQNSNRKSYIRTSGNPLRSLATSNGSLILPVLSLYICLNVSQSYSTSFEQHESVQFENRWVVGKWGVICERGASGRKKNRQRGDIRIKFSNVVPPYFQSFNSSCQVIYRLSVIMDRLRYSYISANSYISLLRSWPVLEHGHRKEQWNMVWQ